MNLNRLSKTLALTFAIAAAPATGSTIPRFDVRPTDGIENLRASIETGSTPSALKVNFKFFSNFGADLKAPQFVIHQQSSKPSHCPDFTGVRVPVVGRTDTSRTFNVSQRPDILQALNDYQCVIISNFDP